MQEGRVKFFDSKKGFGFIVNEETGQEYFVHVSSTIDMIRDNDLVLYDIEEGKKGQVAVNVKLA